MGGGTGELIGDEEAYLAVWGDNIYRNFREILGCLKFAAFRKTVEYPWGGSVLFSFFKTLSNEIYGDNGFEAIMRQYIAEKGFSEEDLDDSTWTPTALRAKVRDLEKAAKLADDLREIFEIKTAIYSPS